MERERRERRGEVGEERGDKREEFLELSKWQKRTRKEDKGEASAQHKSKDAFARRGVVLFISGYILGINGDRLLHRRSQAQQQADEKARLLDVVDI